MVDIKNYLLGVIVVFFNQLISGGAHPVENQIFSSLNLQVELRGAQGPIRDDAETRATPGGCLEGVGKTWMTWCISPRNIVIFVGGIRQET